AENADPAIYVLFDMPYLNGENLRSTPLIERKKKLEALLKRRKNPLLAYSAHQVGHGREMFEQAQYNGLEGIVSKKVDSPYRGDRNGDWVKVKARPSDEFAVVGFTDPKGGRTGIGALLLAKYGRGEWVYIGRVGTGFTDKQLRALRKQLSKDVVATPSANADLMERKDHASAIWVKPKLVVEVFYQGYGGQGLLRQAAFKTLRVDKTTADLVAADKDRKRSSQAKKT
ncbi:MAG: ATP dependent DNA ligase, partial [Burkholderiales bacterium]